MADWVKELWALGFAAAAGFYRGLTRVRGPVEARTPRARMGCVCGGRDTRRHPWSMVLGLRARQSKVSGVKLRGGLRALSRSGDRWSRLLASTPVVKAKVAKQTGASRREGRERGIVPLAGGPRWQRPKVGKRAKRQLGWLAARPRGRSGPRAVTGRQECVRWWLGLRAGSGRW